MLETTKILFQNDFLVSGDFKGIFKFDFVSDRYTLFIFQWYVRLQLPGKEFYKFLILRFLIL